MKIINMPTDWTKKYIVIGYDISREDVIELLAEIQGIIKDNNQFAIISTQGKNPDAIVEFIEVTWDTL